MIKQCDAVTYVVKYALKSADSMHLATAVELKETIKEIGENVIFVCDDRELIDAGRRENLEVLSPRDSNDAERLKRLILMDSAVF